MTSKTSALVLVIGCSLSTIAAVSCGKKDEAPPTAASDTAPTSEALAKDKSRFSGKSGKVGAQLNPVRGQMPVTKLNAIPTYPDDGIGPIPPGCTEPWTVLARAPKAVGVDYAFPWPTQALYANPQFRLVPALGSAGEITAEVHEASSGEMVLAVRCHDAGTCRRVAAMYKAVSRGDAPPTGCGALPDGLSSATKKRTIQKAGGEAVPADADPATLCARLGACATSIRPGGEDVGHACEKAPASFKTSCAREPTCAAVEKCRTKDL